MASNTQLFDPLNEHANAVSMLESSIALMLQSIAYGESYSVNLGSSISDWNFRRIFDSSAYINPLVLVSECGDFGTLRVTRTASQKAQSEISTYRSRTMRNSHVHCIYGLLAVARDLILRAA